MSITWTYTSLKGYDVSPSFCHVLSIFFINFLDPVYTGLISNYSTGIEFIGNMLFLLSLIILYDEV